MYFLCLTFRNRDETDNSVQAMRCGGYYVFTLSRCPDVRPNIRISFASLEYGTDFDEI